MGKQHQSSNVTRTTDRRPPQSVRRLGKALIALAQAQLEAEAQAQAEATATRSSHHSALTAPPTTDSPPTTGDAA